MPGRVPGILFAALYSAFQHGLSGDDVEALCKGENAENERGKFGFGAVRADKGYCHVTDYVIA